MKIGLFTSGYQRNSLEDAFVDAKRFGYDYIELWGGRPHGYAPDLEKGELKEVTDLIEKYEMPVEIFTPEHNAYPYNFMIGSEIQWQDSMAYLKLSMKMAKSMGASSTLVSPANAGYYTSYDEIWDRLIRSVDVLSKYGEKIGMKLILEPLTPFESNVCTTANDLAKVFGQIKSENLIGMCDVVPAYLQHESIMAYFKKLGDKMGHLHLIDSDGTSDTHVLPGEGVMPLKELVEEIRDFGYKGTATIELVTAYINEPRFYAKRAINNVRNFLCL